MFILFDLEKPNMAQERVLGKSSGGLTKPAYHVAVTITVLGLLYCCQAVSVPSDVKV